MIFTFVLVFLVEVEDFSSFWGRSC